MSASPTLLSSTPVPSMFAEPEVAQQLHRITLTQYHRLGELGVLDRKTELIRGIVVDKVSKSPLHAWLTQKLTDWLRGGVGDGWTVRTELPVTLEPSVSEPEPDVCVVSGSVDDYFTEHPKTAALAIEIAITTEKLDRRKAPIYAESVLPEYWLFLPKRRLVEVYRQPVEGQYQTVQVLTHTDTLSPQAFPNLTLALDTVLPEAQE